jgi:hypothetical protein
MALDDMYKRDEEAKAGGDVTGSAVRWPAEKYGVYVPPRFEGLKALAETCRILAYITGAIAIIAALCGVVQMLGPFMNGLQIVLIAVIGGFVQCTILAGLAEAALALREIEETVRANNELLRKMLREKK